MHCKNSPLKVFRIFHRCSMLYWPVSCRLATHLKNREKSRKIISDEKSGKLIKNCPSHGKFTCFVNVLENIDIMHFIFIFCQSIRVISVTVCYSSADRSQGEI